VAAPDILARLGERLRRRRFERGLSLRALADLSGVAPSTISRIENGLFTPTFTTAVQLGQALGLDFSEVPRDSAAAADAGPSPSTAGSDARPDGRGGLSLQAATSPVPVRRQRLRPGIRKDLRRIACRQPYRFLVVLDGEVQIRARDGSRLSLRPGLRLDCDLLRKDMFFAISANPAELLWIG